MASYENMDITLLPSLEFSLPLVNLPLIMHNDLTAGISQQLQDGY